MNTYTTIYTDAVNRQNAINRQNQLNALQNHQNVINRQNQQNTLQNQQNALRNQQNALRNQQMAQYINLTRRINNINNTPSLDMNNLSNTIIDKNDIKWTDMQHKHNTANGNKRMNAINSISSDKDTTDYIMESYNSKPNSHASHLSKNTSNQMHSSSRYMQRYVCTDSDL